MNFSYPAEIVEAISHHLPEITRTCPGGEMGFEWIMDIEIVEGFVAGFKGWNCANLLDEMRSIHKTI